MNTISLMESNTFMAWKESKTEHPNYRRMDYVWREHRRRFTAYVDANGLPCQACGGYGGEIDPVTDEGQGPWEECGFCLGTGKTSRWLRGQWLTMMRKEKRKRDHRAVD